MAENKYRVNSSHPSLREDDIKKIENWIQAKLPEDYRSFLLTCNGGDPENAYFKWKLRGHELWVNEFYPFIEKDSKKDYLGSIYWAHEKYGKVIPKKFLIIGTIVRDDLLLINLNKDESGSIWMKFWDEANKSSIKYMEMHPEDAVHKLADNFSDFIDSLSGD